MNGEDAEKSKVSLGVILVFPVMSSNGYMVPTKGGLTTRFDPPPNGLRELKLHRSSANGCTKRKIFLKIFFDIRFRS